MKYTVILRAGTIGLLLILSLQLYGDSPLAARMAEDVRKKIPGSSEFPKGKKGQIYDLSSLDLEAIFKELGYRTIASSDQFAVKGAVRRVIVLEPANEVDSREMTISLVAGHSSSGDAQEMMFADMAGSTTMMITESTYERLEDGPGEVCLARVLSAKMASDIPREDIGVWFYRKSVAMISAPLHAAKAIDDAVKRCPLVDVNDFIRELPDLDIQEPEATDTEGRKKYRIRYHLSRPLEEWQKIVVHPTRAARISVLDGYIEVTPGKGRGLPELWIGVHDSKKIWVKWHGEKSAINDSGTNVTDEGK